MTLVRRVRSEALTHREVAALQALFDEAWPGGDFTDEDRDHTFGGAHFLVQDGAGEILAHASVVERTLWSGGGEIRTGYVEGVATRETHRRRGLASDVMRAAGEHLDERFELGALGTDVFDLYEPLGWIRWRGPTAVRTQRGDVRTPDEDGFVMVRRTPASPPLDLDAWLVCDPRPGDVW